jgi:hypothetical protein
VTSFSVSYATRIFQHTDSVLLVLVPRPLRLNFMLWVYPVGKLWPSQHLVLASARLHHTSAQHCLLNKTMLGLAKDFGYTAASSHITTGSMRQAR